MINLAGTTGGAILDQSAAAGALVITGNLTATGSGAKNTYSARFHQRDSHVSRNIPDSAGGVTHIRKQGTGTWGLAGSGSTYRGETIMAAGVLNVASVSDYGVASSIGARQLADENTSATGIGLHFAGGTLQYTGSTPQSTNRQIRVLNGATGSTIDASGQCQLPR